MSRLWLGRGLTVLWIAVLAVGMAACGHQPVKPVSEMDTPEHHFFLGQKALDEGRIQDAGVSFERALQLDPKFSRAYAGKGIVAAYGKDPKGALSAVDRAWRHAGTNDEKAYADIAYIRVYTLNQSPSNWLDLAREKFDFAVQYDPRSSGAYYFMGMAYRSALEFEKARGMFARVAELRGDYTAQASTQWELMDKIQRAMPGTATGKKIALVEKITRADAAALFMEELKIDTLYERRTVKTFDTSFREPGKPARSGLVTPKDVANHPLKADIEGLLQYGVRGLEVYPDGTFDPAGLVSRAAYAMMIEDILIKVTGDEKLATKFIGSPSPFGDLRSDLPYFNAVMVVTSRGIMKGNLATGQFSPDGPVSGVDALLIIKEFKEQLKF
jgi:tetratricopeptide (TPR) repeat protein